MSRILITGASGMIGRALVASLAENAEHDVITTDLAPADDLPAGVAFHRLDVTGEDPARVLADTRPDLRLEREYLSRNCHRKNYQKHPELSKRP